MKTKQIGSLIQLTADHGYIHRRDSEFYAKSLVMLPGESVELYEEVDSVPAYTKAEYEAKVAALVRQRYTESEEFALQRKAINMAFSPMAVSDMPHTTLKEYQAYNTYVEECKAKAKNPELYKDNIDKINDNYGGN